jgi:hypothetical protein
MLDAIQLVETLPNSASTVYGMRGTAMALPIIDPALAANDPGRLKTELTGLPKGSLVSDGKNQTMLKSGQTAIDLSGWNLAQLKLSLPNGTPERLSLQIRATCTEENGTVASTTKLITVKLLDGKTCATPVGMNPYVRYQHDTTETATGAANKPTLAASPLKPEDRSHGIQVPGGSGHKHDEPEDSDEALENWMKGLEHSLNKAFMEEIGKHERI